MNAIEYGDAEVWAAEVGSYADLSDERLNQRFADVLFTFADHPLDSIPQACGSVHEAKATYRFFQNERFTADDLRAPLTAVTAEHCRGQKVVLAVQDTTSANFSNLKHTTGLGPIGSGKHAQGLYLHTTLALRPDGVPLGLLHQDCWSRLPENQAADPQSSEIPDKESRKWLHGLAGVEASLKRLPDAQRPRVIHLMDREGDIHDVLQTISASRDGGIIRSAQNRVVAGPIRLAHDAVAAAELRGTTTLALSARNGQPARKATLELRTLKVTITPSCKHHGQSARKPIDWTLVEARETAAPAGVTPLHWLLWTTEPAQTLAEILEILRLYTLRWRIEDFHLTLKSGCRVEALELETDDRLAKALTIYSAVAVRILTLRDLARLTPDARCTAILSADAWKALVIHFTNERLTALTPIPTIKQATLWIGRLGGHLNRKRDGMPGVRTLWRGWRDLTILVTGYRLGRAAS